MQLQRLLKIMLCALECQKRSSLGDFCPARRLSMFGEENSERIFRAREEKCSLSFHHLVMNDDTLWLLLIITHVLLFASEVSAEALRPTMTRGKSRRFSSRDPWWNWAAFPESQNIVRWNFIQHFSLVDDFVLMCSLLADKNSFGSFGIFHFDHKKNCVNKNLLKFSAGCGNLRKFLSVYWIIFYLLFKGKIHREKGESCNEIYLKSRKR